jgi:hypothetical protein
MLAAHFVGCATPRSTATPSPRTTTSPEVPRAKARCKTTPLVAGKSKDEKPLLLAVSSEEDKYLLFVPNASDWQWLCGPDIVLRGSSKEVRLLISVDVIDTDARDLAPEPYLREVASNVARGMSSQGIRVTQTEVSRPYGISVLRMVLETPDAQKNEKSETYWTMRHRTDGKTVDLHVTAFPHDEKHLEFLRESVPRLMSTFHVKGQRETYAEPSPP